MENLYKRMNTKEKRQTEAISIADWLIDHGSSIRKLAEEFCMTKSTVHRRLTVDLRDVDYDRWKQCQSILKFHKADAVNRMILARKSRK